MMVHDNFFFLVALFSSFGISMLYFFELRAFILQFFHISFFSCWSFSLLHYFYAVFLCCTLLMSDFLDVLHSFRLTLFLYCTFFHFFRVAHFSRGVFFHVSLFLYFTLFMLHSLHVPDLPCWTIHSCSFSVLQYFHAAFLCCTLFMLHFGHFALFSCCTVIREIFQNSFAGENFGAIASFSCSV